MFFYVTLFYCSKYLSPVFKEYRGNCKDYRGKCKDYRCNVQDYRGQDYRCNFKD